MTIVQSSLDHQPRHSQEATLKTGVGGHSCSSGRGAKGGRQLHPQPRLFFCKDLSTKDMLLNWPWGKPASISAALSAAALRWASSFTPSARRGLEFADSVCVLNFPVPLSDTAVSGVLPEPRQLGPAGGTPFSPRVQMWQWNLVHFTLEKSVLALSSGHCLGSFPRAWQIFQMKIKQWLRWLLVLTAAVVGGRLRVSCVTTHSPAQPNAHLREKGGANLFLKEKKVFWVNKSYLC